MHHSSPQERGHQDSPRLLQPRHCLSSMCLLLPVYPAVDLLQKGTTYDKVAPSVVQQGPPQQGGQQFAPQAYAPAPPPQQQAPAPTSQAAASASSNGSPPAPAAQDGVEVLALSHCHYMCLRQLQQWNAPRLANDHFKLQNVAIAMLQVCTIILFP